MNRVTTYPRIRDALHEIALAIDFAKKRGADEEEVAELTRWLELSEKTLDLLEATYAT